MTIARDFASGASLIAWRSTSTPGERRQYTENAMSAIIEYATKPDRSDDASAHPWRAASIAGTPLASAPNAPANAPATLYSANIAVRSRGSAASASAACSTGRNKLTSPADGFSVPMTATTNSGQKLVVVANPIPVSSISAHAASRTRRRPNRSVASPTHNVSAAQRTESDRRQVARQQDADSTIAKTAERARRQQQPRVGCRALREPSIDR